MIILGLEVLNNFDYTWANGNYRQRREAWERPAVITFWDSYRNITSNGIYGI